jgi:hypothetical protein
MMASDPFGSTNERADHASGSASIPPLITFLRAQGIDAPLSVTEARMRTSAGSAGLAETQALDDST